MSSVPGGRDHVWALGMRLFSVWDTFMSVQGEWRPGGEWMLVSEGLVQKLHSLSALCRLAIATI